MLEFHFKFNKKNFKKKAKELKEELLSVLQMEKVILKKAETINISIEFASYLDSKLFNTLNDIYYTIRNEKSKLSPWISRYLPETKIIPDGDILFADFFSGAGGLSQGLIHAGFTPAFVNDHDLAALETYYFNHNLHIDHFYAGDIKDFIRNINYYEDKLSNIKIVAGGPPCQGFSKANQQRLLDDPRNELYKDFLLVLKYIKPDFFIMENVVGMKYKIKEIENDIELYTSINYKYSELILNAKNFDIPQDRKRYFLIGSNVDFNMLELTMNLNYFNSQTTSFNIGDALYGLPKISVNPNKLKIKFESNENGYKIWNVRSDQNEYLKSINKFSTSSNYVFNHKSRYNQPRDVEIFRTLPQGKNSLDESIAHLMPYSRRNSVFKDKYYRLEVDKISKTMTAHMGIDCNSYIHPFQARGISPREAARIQSFPDDYFFRGYINDWYQQIGNAVPVKVGKIISDQISLFYKEK